MKNRPSLFATVLALSALHTQAEPIFERDVQPILKRHCWQCHGEEEKPKGGVDLRLRRFMDVPLEDDRRVVVPGDVEKSEMLFLIRSGEMPKKGKPLTPEEIAIIEKWIAAGAKTLRPEPEKLPPGAIITDEDRAHWAFQPIARPQPPALENPRGEIRNPIDAFVLAKLPPELSPAVVADRATRIRRVWLDLLGLPPSPEEVAQFIADSAPGAHERMIERALASPRYGERWARHWLDAAGYADSNGGPETDGDRPHAWHYRDYVIRAFNADKPWTDFIVEQLAGDELAAQSHQSTRNGLHDPRAVELLTATGFLRMVPDPTGDDGRFNSNPIRSQVLADATAVLGSSLLGLTVACAQCHDHRHDPITHTDYHRLRALLEPTYNWRAWRKPTERLVSLYTPAERAAADAIEAEAKLWDTAADAADKAHRNRVFDERLAQLPEAERESVRAARATPADKRTPEQLKIFKEKPSLNVDVGDLDVFDMEAKKAVQKIRELGNERRKAKPPEQFIMPMLENEGAPPPTHRHPRGDYAQTAERVSPGELSVLAAFDPPAIPDDNPALPGTGRRLAYARWLTSGRHPLVARVIVNRVWQHHFGRGIVATPGDFGLHGARPTHQELLDWLADEFMDGGWKLKPLHRLILNSATYRQSSVNPTSLEHDPDNQLLARFKLQRLDAETVRDAVLAASGTLHEKPSGPAVPVGIDKAGRIIPGTQVFNANKEPVSLTPVGDDARLRSIYIAARRRQPLTVLEAFDAAQLSPSCEVRVTTTVPQQALVMLNDSFIADSALALAKSLRAFSPDRAARIERGWQLILGTSPTAAERERALDFWQKQTALIAQQPTDKLPADPSLLAAASLWQVLFGTNRFLYIE